MQGHGAAPIGRHDNDCRGSCPCATIPYMEWECWGNFSQVQGTRPHATNALSTAALCFLWARARALCRTHGHKNGCRGNHPRATDKSLKKEGNFILTAGVLTLMQRRHHKDFFELSRSQGEGTGPHARRATQPFCSWTLGLTDIINPNSTSGQEEGEAAQFFAPIAFDGAIAAGEKDRRNACNYSDLPRSRRTKKG